MERMESPCGHNFDKFVLIATVQTDVPNVGEVPSAGWMFCPSCDWHGTWAVAELCGHEVPNDEIGEWTEEYRTKAMYFLTGSTLVPSVHDLPSLN